MVWNIAGEAEAASTNVLIGPLRPISLEDFTSPLARAPLATSPEQAAYSELFSDLADLLEEYRFEVAFGLMLLVDFELAVSGGRATQNSATDESALPPVVTGLLTAYTREPPPPARLFTAPYEHMSEFRVLQTWFAAQLFDSALYRGIAALDRLASLIWLAADRPLSSASDTGTWFPAFRESWSTDMQTFLKASGRWGEVREDWGALDQCLDNRLLKYALTVRHGFTHGLRLPSQLHGHHVRANVTQTLALRAFRPEEHEALAVALHDTSLRQATETAGRIVSKLSPRPGVADTSAQRRE